MSKQFLRESDVTLVEETETMVGDTGSRIISGGWMASLHGRLQVNEHELPPYRGSMVEMSRIGGSALGAMKTLREAIELQGWELR